MLSDVKPRATVVLWHCQSGRESVTVDIGNSRRLRPVSFKEQGCLKQVVGPIGPIPGFSTTFLVARRAHVNSSKALGFCSQYMYELG